MGDHTAFFYGTLMASRLLYRVCYGNMPPSPFQLSLLRMKPAILHGYQRHKVLGADYPAIVASAPSSSVRGIFVSGLTDGDIWRLDIFEGSEYKRETVTIKILEKTSNGEGAGSVEGEELETETYVWIAEKRALEEGEWDFADFLKEKLSRWVGGSTEYDEVYDAALTANKDPTGGRGSGGPITEQLEEAHDKDIVRGAV